MIFSPIGVENQIQPVTDSLSLWYDANNSASYPGTGTTWSNLQSTVLNQTLTNGPTFSSNNGGTIVFDGTNDFSTSSNNAIYDFGTGAFTIECWVNLLGNSSLSNSNIRQASMLSVFPPSGAITGWNWTIDGDGTTTGTGLLFQRTISGTATSITYAISGNLTKNVLHQLGITHTGSVTRFFIDGTEVTPSANLSGNVNSGGNTPKIGALGYAGFLLYLNGAMSVVRVYKGKALNKAEIQQNYLSTYKRI
jgi:hypothetical protein